MCEGHWILLRLQGCFSPVIQSGVSSAVVLPGKKLLRPLVYAIFPGGLEVSRHWRGTAPEGISPFNCWRGKKFKHLESKNNFLKIIILGFPGERYCQNSLFLPVYYLHSLNKRKHTRKQAKNQPTKNPHQKNSKTKPQTELHNQLHLCLHLLPMSVYAWWVTSVYGTLFLPDFSLNLPVFWGGFFWRVWMLFKGWKSPLGKFSC